MCRALIAAGRLQPNYRIPACSDPNASDSSQIHWEEATGKAEQWGMMRHLIQ